MIKNYKCFRCGGEFSLKDREDLETDKPICDKCFKQLLKVKTATEYRDFINGKQLDKERRYEKTLFNKVEDTYLDNYSQ